MDERLKQLKQLLKIDEKESRISAIEAQMTEPDFWSDHVKAGQLAQELSALKETVDNYNLVALEPDDPEAIKLLEKLEFESLFTGEHDAAPVVLSIHAGAGGTESQDWASMLYRMYIRYAEQRGWAVDTIDISQGEEAGIKSATLEIKGYYAYGRLKSEAGVHRLVRISPFDADKARHTSFALVEVVPEVENAALEIKPEDLKIDVYRAGGHGGQSVNTTDSAVRITHLPTGIVVAVQNERSQLQNKEVAMKVLQSRLLQKHEEEQRKNELALRGQHVSAEWGNQIRSYVLHPYQMVKDHRTNAESSNTQAILNGDIDLFIEQYLHWTAAEH